MVRQNSIKIIMEDYVSDKVGIIYPTFDEYPNRLKSEQIVGYVPQNKDFAYTADELDGVFMQISNMHYYC